MTTTSYPASADFIIVGGGTAGLSLASRLSKKCPSFDILVLEGAPDQTNHPLTQTPEGAFAAHGSELDWNYDSIPQKQLNDRVIHLSAGKSLSGATAINYGLWLRGPKNDYDRWADLVRDDGWSYDSLLPYFREFETHYDTAADPIQHGFSGPMHTSSVESSHPTRKYPFRENIRQAWEELGSKPISDYNNGYPLGLGDVVENWRDGMRQPASRVLDLSQVNILCNSLVRRVIIEEIDGINTARGVELVNGSKIFARHEVIVSTGSYRTPGLLMHSGIGPASRLNKFDIPILVDNPKVGENYFDHFAIPIYWNVRDPEKGVAAGSPLWTAPGFSKGQPYDFLEWESLPRDILQSGIQVDSKATGLDADADPYSLLAGDRVHTESVVIYAPVAKIGEFPFDGSVITSTVLAMQNTSRGKVTIASGDATDFPLIDPNFYTTETDRVVIRHAIRRILRLMQGTASGKDMVVSMIPARNQAPLTAASTDRDIDAHVKSFGHSWNHPAGTAAMETVLSRGVVNSKCQVHGVARLRVVDASVLPVPIAAHYMVCVYAMGWKVADLVSESAQ